jgi:excisionase family DNA binding protein
LSRYAILTGKEVTGKMASEDKILTVAEAAERLTVGPRTVRRWIVEKRLRAFALGGQKTGYRLRASEVDRFLREQEEKAATS